MLLADPLIGKALYGTKISDVQKIINEHPLIRQTFVRRISPNKLQLNIVDRKIIAFIKFDKMYSNDVDGTLYPLQELKKITRYSIILSIEGKKNNPNTAKKIKKTLKALKTYKKLHIPAGQIYKLHVDSTNEVKVYFANQYEIVSGSEHFEEK